MRWLLIHVNKRKRVRENDRDRKNREIYYKYRVIITFVCCHYMVNCCHCHQSLMVLFLCSECIRFYWPPHPHPSHVQRVQELVRWYCCCCSRWVWRCRATMVLHQYCSLIHPVVWLSELPCRIYTVHDNHKGHQQSVDNGIGRNMRNTIFWW